VGMDMHTWIEYDTEESDWNHWYKDKRELQPPFAEGNNIESLPEWDRLVHVSKDYHFFGAIAGVRNQTEIPSLFSLRGEPPNVCWPIAVAIAHKQFEPVGWLTLSEINAALDHHSVDRALLNDKTLIILDIMEVLERRFGVDRVRLLFEFSG
jgi:hypothetical protein